MIKIGVFGAGRFGRIHMDILKNIPQFEVVGFYDPDKQAAGEAEKSTGLKKFEREDELIEACDAIDIVSSTVSHFALAQRSIRRFKHVFIEKPVTSTIEEARSLMSMSVEAGVKVQAGHVERFNPAFIEAYHHIKNPLFVESHRLVEFNRRQLSASVLEDIMVHDIDIMLQLINSPIKKISANSAGIIDGSPDLVNARIEFENGAAANLTASRLAVKNMRITRVYQKDCSVSINFLENRTGIIRKTEEGNEAELNLPPVKQENAIKTELLRFSDAIINNTEPAVSLDHAIRALTVAAMIKEKLKLQTNFFAEKAIS